MPDPDLGVVVLVNGLGPAFAVADLVSTYIYDLLLEGEKGDGPGDFYSFQQINLSFPQILGLKLMFLGGKKESSLRSIQ